MSAKYVLKGKPSDFAQRIFANLVGVLEVIRAEDVLWKPGTFHSKTKVPKLYVKAILGKFEVKSRAARDLNPVWDQELLMYVC